LDIRFNPHNPCPNPISFHGKAYKMVLWRDDDEAVHEASEILAGLARRCASSLCRADQEDLVQDALIKALGQPRVPGQGAPLAARVRVTFFDVLKDRFRQRARRREELHPEPLDLLPAPPKPDLAARVHLARLCASIKGQLGSDILEYSALISRGYTAAAIADRPGWDGARVDRTRKRLRRNQSLVEAMLALLESKGREVS
jgi:DNA-directed RNA polymerase specialized sigma24 family protein